MHDLPHNQYSIKRKTGNIELFLSNTNLNPQSQHSVQYHQSPKQVPIHNEILNWTRKNSAHICRGSKRFISITSLNLFGKFVFCEKQGNILGIKRKAPTAHRMPPLCVRRSEQAKTASQRGNPSTLLPEPFAISPSFEMTIAGLP